MKENVEIDHKCIQSLKIALMEENLTKSLPRIEDKIDEIYHILQGEVDTPGLVTKVEIIKNIVENNIKDNFIRVWTAIGGVWAVVIFLVGFLLLNSGIKTDACRDYKSNNEQQSSQQSK